MNTVGVKATMWRAMDRPLCLFLKMTVWFHQHAFNSP